MIALNSTVVYTKDYVAGIARCKQKTSNAAISEQLPLEDERLIHKRVGVVLSVSLASYLELDATLPRFNNTSSS